MITYFCINIHTNLLKTYTEASVNNTEDHLGMILHNEPHLNIVEGLLELSLNKELEI